MHFSRVAVHAIILAVWTAVWFALPFVAFNRTI